MSDSNNKKTSFYLADHRFHDRVQRSKYPRESILVVLTPKLGIDSRSVILFTNFSLNIFIKLNRSVYIANRVYRFC